MRAGLVVVGIVFVVLGGVLAYVALVPQSGTFNATTNGSGSMENFTVFDASPALFGGTVAKFSFTSTVSVDLYLITCSKVVTTSQLSSAGSEGQLESDCGTNATYGTTSTSGGAYSTGTSGSFAFSIPASGSVIYFAVSSAPGTVSATITTSEPLAGDILLIVGVLVLIVGLVLKSHKTKASKTGTPTPGAPGEPMNAWSPPGPGAPPSGSAPAGWQQPPPSQ